MMMTRKTTYQILREIIHDFVGTKSRFKRENGFVT